MRSAAVGPSRWQYANFHFLDTISFAFTGTTQPTINTVIELVKIFDHVGDSVTAGGLVMNGLVRSIDVAGILWNAHAHAGFSGDGGRLLEVWEYCCSSRLDADSNPIGVLPDFRTNHVPVINAGSITAASDETEFPTRMHYRQNYVIQYSSNDVGNDAPHYVQTYESRTRRLRLKRRYSDREGLYLGLAFGNLQTGLINLNIQVIITGSVYYRVNFGR